MAAVSALEAWMESMGITWNRDLIRLVDNSAGCSGLALGIDAVQDVPEGASLCEIPKAACISIRTSSISDILEREGLGGGLGLVLAVLHEMALGEESEWAGYLKALPPKEYLPIFWSDEELGTLQGTEAEGKAEQDRELTQDDFETHVLPLLDSYPARFRPEAMTLENYRVASSYVASRAFGIDDYHGDAMVPLADIFNHKASVVELAPGYEVHGAESSDDDDEGDDEMEEGGEDLEGGSSDGEGGSSDGGVGKEGQGPAGGAGAGEGEGGYGAGGHESCAAGCEHAHHHQHHHHARSCDGQRELANGAAVAAAAAGSAVAATSAAAGVEVGGSMPGEQEFRAAEDIAGGAGLAAGAGIMSSHGAGGKPHGIYGITSANGLHLRLEIAILDKDDHLEIVAASAVPKGQEIHNTYGEKGNSELLVKYGFALRDNPFTAVSLDKNEVLGAAKKALGARAFKARCKFLEEETDVLDPEEEPFEVLPNGHINPPLFVALRVFGADEVEAKQWGGISDALALPPLPENQSHAAETEAAARAAGEAAGEREGEGEEGEEEGASIPAVQIWAVREGDAAGPGSAPCAAIKQENEPGAEPLGSQPLRATSGTAVADDAAGGAAAGAGGCSPAISGAEARDGVPPAEGAEAEKKLGGGQPAGAGGEGAGCVSSSEPLSQSARLASLLSQRACAMLRHAVQSRLARYRGTLGEDLEQWQHTQQAQQGAAQLPEHDAAVTAALLLRISEKEVLHEMLKALDLRTQQQEAEVQHAQQQQEGAAGALSKGRKRGRQQAASQSRQPKTHAKQQQQQQQQQEEVEEQQGRGKRTRAQHAKPAAQQESGGKAKQGSKSQGAMQAAARRRR